MATNTKEKELLQLKLRIHEVRGRLEEARKTGEPNRIRDLTRDYNELTRRAAYIRVEIKKAKTPAKKPNTKRSTVGSSSKKPAQRSGAYYAPELFAAEMRSRIEEKRSALGGRKLHRTEVEEIMQDIFKTGVKRPEVIDE